MNSYWKDFILELVKTFFRIIIDKKFSKTKPGKQTKNERHQTTQKLPPSFFWRIFH